MLSRASDPAGCVILNQAKPVEITEAIYPGCLFLAIGQEKSVPAFKPCYLEMG